MTMGLGPGGHGYGVRVKGWYKCGSGVFLCSISKFRLLTLAP